MDHPAGRKPPGLGRDCVPDLDRTLRDRLPLDLLPSGALDRPGHAGAHPEVVVGGVGDRVDRERSDVAVDDLELEPHVEKLFQFRHTPVSESGWQTPRAAPWPEVPGARWRCAAPGSPGWRSRQAGG